MRLHHFALLMGLVSGAAPAISQDSPTLANVSRATIVKEDAIGVTLQFDLSELTAAQLTSIRSSQSPAAPSDKEAAHSGLPAITRYVVVPPLVGLELHVESGASEIIPADPPDFSSFRITDGGSELSASKPPLLDGVYPSSNAVMSEPEVIRGIRVVRVTAYPLQYDYSRKAYLSHANLNVSIRYTADPPVNPVEFPVRRGRSKEFLKYISALAVNGDQVGRDDPNRDSPNPSSGHYLIVAREECLPFIRPFIEWRRKGGYSVDIVTLDRQDGQNPDIIKQRIQESYDAYLEQGLDPFDELLLVGDRSDYYMGGAQQWILESFDGTNSFGGDAAHADYLFACLEGEDDNPDVAVSRWWAGSEETLGLAVGRTLAYEANPYWENQDWFSRSGAYYQHWGESQESAFHPSMAMTARWAKEALRVRGYNPVEWYENMDWDQWGRGAAEVINEWLTGGTSLMVGRAQMWGWTGRAGLDPFDPDPHPVFPINLMLGGFSAWTTGWITRVGDAEHLKGPSAMACSWGDVPTLWMNATMMEMTSGIVQHDLPLGWARLYAVNAIPAYLGDPGINQNPTALLRTEIDCYGDPAIQPWCGTPREVSVELTTPPEPHGRLYEARIVDGNDDPVAGVVVALYAPGELPDDPAQYVEYAGYRILTAISDQNGVARFLFDDDPDLTIGTPLFVTATGRDVKPAFFEARIAAAEMGVALDGFVLTEIEGNDDGAPNPGESLALRIRVRNDGERIENVAATLTCSSLWLDVVGENRIAFGAISAGEQSNGDRAVTVRLDSAAPDGALYPEKRPEILIEFSSGESRWTTSLRLDPRSPGLAFESVIGGDVIPDSIYRLDVQIANRGGIASAPLIAELRSLDAGVTVIRNQARYSSIARGESGRIDGATFEVSGGGYTIPGSRHRMQMNFATESGFRDTIEFSLQVMTPREHAPQVPDPYGYICFDDSDSAWDMAPTYQWIEICPDVEEAEYQGQRLNFRGESPLNIGEALAIPLGFETQFYGEQFDTITVTTNGFIALGNQPDAVSFQNFPMDRAIGGGAGLIAPLWTNLHMTGNSGVFAFYDEETDRVIVEWRRMRYASNDAEAELTFEAIIYDRNAWPSFTGDPLILFQYKTVEIQENVPDWDAAWNNCVPFPSVGISSPDGKSGVSYCFNNAYPVSAAPLQDRRALLFTTTPRFNTGEWVIHGLVTDAATRNALPDVRVSSITPHGFIASTLSNAEGRYELGLIPLVENWWLRFSKQGYNDTLVVVDAGGDEDSLNIEFNMAMLHPEFFPSHWNIAQHRGDQDSIRVPFNVSNRGNGPLRWRVEKSLPDGAGAPPWTLRNSFDVGQILDDDRIQGVAFANDRYYISGANGSDSSQIYVLNRNGDMIELFDQPCHTRYGFNDLEWDGELLWGSGDTTVYGLSPDGRLVRSWTGPFRPTNNIAWDSDRNLLYLSGTTTNIMKYDREGNVVGDSLSRKTLRIFGLAYYPDDSDGYHLYILSKTTPDGCQIYKMNPETGDTLFVREVDLMGGTAMTGLYITSEYDVYSWVCMTVVNIHVPNGGDRLAVYQLESNKSWFDLQPTEGTLQAGNVQDFILELNMTGLPDTLWEGSLDFTHNADSGFVSIPIRVGSNVSVERPSDIPVTLELSHVYPNPFNFRTEAVFTIRQTGRVKLQLYNLTGRKVATLADGELTAGTHRVMIDGSRLASGLYYLRLESGGEVTTVKAVLLK